MSGENLIIFGPTGHVGSAVTRSIHNYGNNKVFLAMRDPQKPIPGLSREQEKERDFERIQADLRNPESIHSVVGTSGAKRAFIYLIHGSTDNMRSSIEALKSAGIEYVVFLSSVSVKGDLRSIQHDNHIPWVHAQVEIALDDVFGHGNFVAIRPAYFANNALWWKKMIAERGEVKLVYPQAKFDNITPTDMGRVAAAFLAGGVEVDESVDEPNSVNLCGPEMISQRDMWGIIGRVLGKNLKITEMDEKEALEVIEKEMGMPALVVPQLIAIYKRRAEEESEGRSGDWFQDAYMRSKENVPKYAGTKPTTLEEWVKENTWEFEA
ncbi:NAD(P)-binding protein [Rhizodiscina lignyota]|uniref:NAD(P)-binding protein n=1 Tax=Rhizodiscina lignyota TaxID=1504668 RepID=A0A9P4IS40_9PEZI|nr:NAD(P)-binding protein [Rhizodiscina lignyota]